MNSVSTRQVTYGISLVPVRAIGSIGCVSLVLAVALTGCNSSDRPSLAPVHGIVTMDGKPLKKATVSFHPMEGGRQSCDMTDENGEYQLTYIRDVRGAKVGKHRVTIQTASTEGPKAQKEHVPACYNSKSTLQADVQSHDNEFNFDLKSS